jgi:hypothetical protein
VFCPERVVDPEQERVGLPLLYPHGCSNWR